MTNWEAAHRQLARALPLVLLGCPPSSQALSPRTELLLLFKKGLWVLKRSRSVDQHVLEINTWLIVSSVWLKDNLVWQLSCLRQCAADWWTLNTDLESACILASAVQGYGWLGRKPDPESAARGFESPGMTWWRVVSCGLASTNQNGIGRWLPLIQAFKMDFTHSVSPLRRDGSNKDRRKEAKK